VCPTSHSHDTTETQVFQLLKVPFWLVGAFTWWVDLATLEYVKKGESSAFRQAQIITDGICTVACGYTNLVLLNVLVQYSGHHLSTDTSQGKVKYIQI
jgi:hypothetical protein